MERIFLWLFGVTEAEGSQNWSIEFLNPVAGWLLVMIVIPIGCFLLFCQFTRRTRGAWRDWKSLEM